MYEKTSLTIAIDEGKFEIVQFLLNIPGIDVNFPSKKNQLDSWTEYTPLQIAVFTNNADIVKLLLSTPGIDVNKKSTNQINSGLMFYYNALHVAIINKKYYRVKEEELKKIHNILKILLDCKKIDVNSKYTKRDIYDFEKKRKICKL